MPHRSAVGKRSLSCRQRYSTKESTMSISQKIERDIGSLQSIRHSRRTFVGGVAAAGAAVAVGGAIGTSAQDADGGQISFALGGDATLNPFTWPNQQPTILVCKNVFSTLVKYSDEGDSQIIGDLATTWEASEDGLTWTFNLRDDVLWHDGEPFTAEDVKFTIEGLLDPAVNAQFRTNLTGVTGAEVIDDHTVAIHTEVPLGSLPLVFAYNIAIAPAHLLEGQNLNEIPEFVQQPIGTGPYKVESITHGDQMVLKANEDYFEGVPSIQTLVYRVIPDVNQIVAQLQTGELDMAEIPAANRATLEGSGNVSFTSTLETSTFCIYTNNHRFPFDDATVRRAATHAIDRQVIVDQLLLGEAEIATGPYSSAFGDFFNADLEPIPFDVEAGATLMTEAGFEQVDGIWSKDGQAVEIELYVDQGNPVREQLAQVVQQFLQDFGFTVNLQIVEWSVYIDITSERPGKYDARTGWRFTAPDPDKSSEYGTDGTVNHYGYSNPEVDELFDQGRTEVDHEKRVEIYHEIQRLIYDDTAIIWMYYPKSIFAFNSRIQGVPEVNYRNALLYVHKMTISG